MKIVFNNTDAKFNTWATHYDKMPYEQPNYWSMVFKRLRNIDETNDTFFKRINDDWGIRVINERAGISGVEIDDSTLSILLMKYPIK